MAAVTTWPDSISDTLANRPILLALGVITILLFINWQFNSNPIDPTEPPVLSSKIPFVGHLIGIAQYQADYLDIVSKRTKWPIYALKVLTGKIYVITSPELVQAVFKNSKTLSFDPITTSASKNIFLMTDRQIELLARKEPGDTSTEEHPLAKETYVMMHRVLQNEASLAEMEFKALNRFSSFLNEIKDEEDIELHSWIRHRLSIATSEALYGPKNPITEDNSLIQSLETFTSSIGLLYLNILPSLTCPSGHRARAAFTNAFKRYYAQDHHLAAGPLILGRHEVLTRGGYTHDDLAMFDIGMLMGATMNSIPALFWLLTFIYSSPSLLSSLRSELGSVTTFTSSSKGIKEARLDTALLQQKCPTLVATWKETLRLRGAGISTRMVTEDVLLDGKWKLKKGCVIQMPGWIMHTDEKTWSPISPSSTISTPTLTPTTNSNEAQKFNPSNFLSPDPTLSKPLLKARQKSYVPFGGGTVLCPGRYFASNEIMGIAGMIISSFDLLPIADTAARDEGEGLKLPGIRKQAMSEQIKHPDSECRVRMRRREGWKDVVWSGKVVGVRKGGEGGGEREEMMFG